MRWTSRLGDQVRAAVGLAVLGGDAEGSIGGQQNVENALVGKLVHTVLLRAVGEVGIEVGEPSEEGRDIALRQGVAEEVAVVVVFLLCELPDELGVEGAADLFIRDAEGET